MAWLQRGVLGANASTFRQDGAQGFLEMDEKISGRGGSSKSSEK